MRVLMISLDRGLLGQGHSGDVVERHQKYADLIGHLDAIVLSPEKARVEHSANFIVQTTGSPKWRHWSVAFEIASELMKQKTYNLLITQDFAAPTGARIKKKFGLPWIVSIHGMFFSREWLGFSLLNWFLFHRVKRALKTTDGFRVNNHVIEKKLMDWGLTVPILVQPTAINLSKFSSHEKRFGDSLSGPELKILFVGRLSKEKNIGMLINVINKLNLKSARLTIVGGGPESDRLKSMAAGNTRIIFAGPKHYEELPEIFQKADIFVLPSNTETFGQVLLQAAAAGLAIVATKTAGAKSILSDQEDAILIDVGREDQLQLALQKLADHPEIRRTLGEAAMNTASRFDSDKMTRKLVEFWRSIIIKS